MIPCERQVSRSNPDDYPDFFKIYMPEINSNRLRIPPAFMKNFKGNVPKHAVIKNSAGRFWSMDLEGVDGCYFLTKGWEGFVRDNSLERGDFLVFGYNGNYVLLVKVFGKDGCMKAETLAKNRGFNYRNVVKQEDVAMEQTHACRQESSKSNGCPEQNRPPPSVIRFVKTYSGKTYSLNIPSEIVSQYDFKVPVATFLRSQNCIVQPAKIVRRADGRIVVTDGWKKFCQKSNILPGDDCEYEILLGPSRRVKEIMVRVRVRVRVSKNKPAKPALSWETASD